MANKPDWNDLEVWELLDLLETEREVPSRVKAIRKIIERKHREAVQAAAVKVVSTEVISAPIVATTAPVAPVVVKTEVPVAVKASAADKVASAFTKFWNEKIRPHIWRLLFKAVLVILAICLVSTALKVQTILEGPLAFIGNLILKYTDGRPAVLVGVVFLTEAMSVLLGFFHHRRITIVKAKVDKAKAEGKATNVKK